MGGLRASQRIILSIISGILISGSHGIALILYLLLTGVLLVILKPDFKHILGCLKISTFIFSIYLIAGFFGYFTTKGHDVDILIYSVIPGIPVITAVLFVLLISLGTGLSEIQDGIGEVFGWIPFFPVFEIGIMVSLVYRFFLEGQNLWRQHRELFQVRRPEKVSIFRTGTIFLVSPLIALFSKSDQISEAFLIRSNPKKEQKLSFKSGIRFWLLLIILIAIKIISTYTD